MDKKKLNGFIGASIAGLLLAVGGCKSPSKSGAQVEASVLRCDIATNIVTLDPAKMTDVPTLEVLKHVFSGLVELGKDNQPVPAAAESWDISPDGKVYTFHLRKNAKFNTGREVTAEDVKWSLERASNPIFASPTAENFLNDIVGFEEMNKGKAKTISGVEAVDKHTVKITIKQPRSYFLSKLTYHVACILPKGDVSFDKPIASVKEVIGTGPFKMSEYVSDQLVALTPNEHYYGEKPKLSKVQFRVIKDSMTRLSAYKSGKLDLIEAAAVDIDNLQADTKYKKQLHEDPTASTFWLELNPKKYKPFADKRVRQAFIMAIDAKNIVNNALMGKAIAADSILPPGIPGRQDKPKNLPYDPAKAKQLLAEAGYASGAQLPPLQLTASSKSPATKAASENAVIQLKKAFPGFRITLNTPSWDAYLDQLHRKEIPFRFGGWLADYLDPANFLSDLFSSKSSMNYIFFANKEFDDLCAKADSLLDPAQRWPLYAKAENILLDEAVVLPLFYKKEYHLVQDYVSGLESNLMGYRPFVKVEVK